MDVRGVLEAVGRERRALEPARNAGGVVIDQLSLSPTLQEIRMSGLDAPLRGHVGWVTEILLGDATRDERSVEHQRLDAIRVRGGQHEAGRATL